METNAFRFLRSYGDFDVESTSLGGTRLIAVAETPSAGSVRVSRVGHG
jgi:hypothetical protein